MIEFFFFFGGGGGGGGGPVEDPGALGSCLFVVFLPVLLTAILILTIERF